MMWVPSGISVQEQGSLDLTSDHEAQGDHLKGPKGLEFNHKSNLINILHLWHFCCIYQVIASFRC